MVDAVNRLVGNILAGPGALFLPEVGSLRTERQPARRLSKRRILPPCRIVSFASQQQGVSLVDEIAAAAGVDGEKAAEIYRTWLGRVRREERLEIEGVGTLVQKSFRLDPAFDRRLNPAGYEPVKIRSGRRFDFVLWLGVAAILFGVGFGGYWWWNDRVPSERRVSRCSPRRHPGRRPIARLPLRRCRRMLRATELRQRLSGETLRPRMLLSQRSPPPRSTLPGMWQGLSPRMAPLQRRGFCCAHR